MAATTKAKSKPKAPTGSGKPAAITKAPAGNMGDKAAKGGKKGGKGC
jgi:hypothetical protein